MGQRSKAIGIVGMHRSGTSMVTGALHILGAYLGKREDLVPPGEDNPEGFWEHARIVDIHERILSVLNRTWHTTVPLPDKWWKSPVLRPLREELTDFIQAELLPQELWAWKDPRTSLLLPLWHDILERLQVDPFYVICIRNPLDVAHSLKKRDGFSIEKSLGVWNLYTLSSLYWLRDKPKIIVHYDHFLEDWETNLKRIANTFHLLWPQQISELQHRMSRFLKPELRHTKTELQQLFDHEQIGSSLTNTYKLCLQAEHSVQVLASDEFNQQINDFYLDYRAAANMISADGEDSNCRIQIFLPSNGHYSEQHSTVARVFPDGKFHTYELAFTDDLSGDLRIDPVNIPSYVEIKSIEVIDEKRTVLMHRSASNHFAGITFGHGTLPLGEQSTSLSFLSTNHDPQLYVRNLPKITNASPFRVRIQMCVYKQISPSLGEKIDAVFTALDRRVKTLSYEIANKERMIQSREGSLQRIEDQLRDRDELLRQIKDFLLNQIVVEQFVDDHRDLTGYFDRVDAKGNKIFGYGWARNPFNATVSSEVILTADAENVLIGHCVANKERKDVANVFRDKRMSRSGWEIVLDKTVLQPGLHTIKAYMYFRNQKKAYKLNGEFCITIE
ncbi:hypothetical protein LOK74_08665 [Brevibacillus humidisoli]|uniref:sulfotransferase family protein n=1 Tax=Brevibacillus humidisoli TaxID=2895522 RepID=UPI001E346CF6|nr:hypothetical protein [Brevibacillus humidisoli]UFJ42545.1 hypothetical protein LOK74_08665 [Brevibacillus humidisoli]